MILVFALATFGRVFGTAFVFGGETLQVERRRCQRQRGHTCGSQRCRGL